MDCYADIEVQKLRNELEERLKFISADVSDIKKFLFEILVELRKLNEK